MDAMPPALTPEEIDRLAHKRAAAKMGWYIHALVYLCVNAYLFLGESIGLRSRPFNAGPALGWGLGLAFHFISVFVLGKHSGLREQMVQRERERILRDQNRP